MESLLHLSGRTARSFTAILLVVVLVSLVACGLSAGTTDTPTATSVPTAAMAAASTATSTATVAPARTPTAAVSLPPATATPAIVARPAGKEQYLADMYDISRRWETWSAEADALMSEVGQDPLAVCITRSGDIDARITGGRELLAALAAASPPEEIASEHRRLIDEGTAGLDALEEGKAALCRRLDTGTALTKMDEVNEHLVNAYIAADALFTWAGEQ